MLNRSEPNVILTAHATKWHTKYLVQVLRWYLYLVVISTKYFVKLVLVLVL